MDMTSNYGSSNYGSSNYGGSNYGSSNYYLEHLDNFYIKKSEVDSKLASIGKDVSKSVKRTSTNTIEYSWNYSGLENLKFSIPSVCDELTGEDMTRLNTMSFIHSILYIIDPDYYAGLTEQKRADCIEFIELLRKDFYIKEKLSKEATCILQNLENNIYSEATIQHIVNFFDSFHLIIVSSDIGEPPKLFINNYSGKKGSKRDYKTASSIIVLYFDHNREVYYPALYDPEDRREGMSISWQEPEFLQFIKNVQLWGKSSDTKKWAVADLREWIAFFGLNINTELDKKAILELLPATMS
jgi:hypothetical protein